MSDYIVIVQREGMTQRASIPVVADSQEEAEYRAETLAKTHPNSFSWAPNALAKDHGSPKAIYAVKGSD